MTCASHPRYRTRHFLVGRGRNRARAPVPEPRRRDAETGRHADLHDPGRRAAELRRAPREHIRDDPLGRAFYSTLIQVNPEDPGSGAVRLRSLHRDADAGRRRQDLHLQDPSGVKFHDGTPLTSADIVASWNTIIFPPEGMVSPRQGYFMMVDKVEAPDPQTVVFRLKFATRPFCRRWPTRSPSSTKGRSSTRTRTGTRRTSMGSGPFKFVAYDTGQSIRGERNPDYFKKGLPYLDGFVGIFAESRRRASTRSAPTAPQWNSAACRPRRARS